MVRMLLPAILAGMATVLPLWAQDGAALVVIRAERVFDGQRFHGPSEVHVDSKTGLIVGFAPTAEAATPPGAEVKTLPAGAVLMPGLVLAAGEGLVALPLVQESLLPTLCPSDAWDPLAPRPSWRRQGVTSVALSPGGQRFLPGHLSLVRPAAEPMEQVAIADAALVFDLTRAAYDAPLVYETTVPPGPDDPFVPAQARFPKNRAGAFTALRTILGAAKKSQDQLQIEGLDLDLRPIRAAIAAGRPLRVRAELAEDIRGVLRAAQEHGIFVVIEGATEAWKLAEELAAVKAPAGVGLVLRAGQAPGGPSAAPAGWPRPDGDPHPEAAAVLMRAGVRVALVPVDTRQPEDFLHHIARAARGGASEADLLKAVTFEAAQLSGAQRAGVPLVGVIAKGARADLVAIDRSPLLPGAGPLWTMVSGALLTKPKSPPGEVAEAGAVHLFAERVRLGNGTVLEPGEVITQGGKILAVGRGLVAPVGAEVHRVVEVIPGFIDMGAQIGIRRYVDEGSGELRLGAPIGPLPTESTLAQIYDRSLPDVRAAAEAGVTTVALTPRSPTGIAGVISLVKTVAASEAEAVLRAEAGLFVDFGPQGFNPGELGRLDQALQAGKKYRDDWAEYEKKKAAFDKEQAEAAEKRAKERPAVESPKLDLGTKPRKPAPFDPYVGTWNGHLTGLVPGQAVPVRVALRRDGELIKGELELLGPRNATASFAVTPAGGAMKFEVSVFGESVGVQLAVLRDELRGTWASNVSSGQALLLRTSREVPPAPPAPVEETSAEPGEGEAPVRRPRRAPPGERAGGEAAPAKTPEGAEATPATEAKPAETKPEDKKEEPKKDEPKKEEAKSTEPEAPKPPRTVASREIYRSLINASVPLFVRAGDERSGREALRLGRQKFDLRTVIVGAPPLKELLAEVSQREAALGLVGESLGRVRGEIRNPFADAVRAKVATGFWSGPEGDPRGLYEAAALAVAYGLPPEQALQALTRFPALIFGVFDRVGSIEVGKDADLVILDGPAFQPATRIAKVMGNGRFLDAPAAESQR